MQFSIPFGVIAGSIHLGEKVSQKRWLLIGLVLFGLAIICFDPIVLQSPYSLMLGCLAAISYGLASMMSRKLADFSALEVNAWMAVTTLPIMILLTFIFENQEFKIILQHSWWDYLPAIYTGVVVSCGAQVLMFWLYKHYSVQTVLPFYSLFPIFGIILTIILIQEPLSFYIVVGSIIVITGNYLLQKTK
jgi:O-acetylserine/cysteine efflux transporter